MKKKPGLQYFKRVFQCYLQELKSIADTDAYVLVFSITSRSSFQYVLETAREVRRWPHGQKVAVIVVANKSDLVRNRVVTEDGENRFIMTY